MISFYLLNMTQVMTSVADWTVGFKQTALKMWILGFLLMLMVLIYPFGTQDDDRQLVEYQIINC